MTDFNIQDQGSLESAIRSMAARIIEMERKTNSPASLIGIAEVEELSSRPEPVGLNSYCWVRSLSQWFETAETGTSSPPAPPVGIYDWVESLGPPSN
jgi:hypothetical protein